MLDRLAPGGKILDVEPEVPLAWIGQQSAGWISLQSTVVDLDGSEGSGRGCDPP